MIRRVTDSFFPSINFAFNWLIYMIFGMESLANRLFSKVMPKGYFSTVMYTVNRQITPSFLGSSDLQNRRNHVFT